MTVKVVEVNGKKYPVRFDVQSLEEFEALTNTSYFKALESPSMTSYLALAYVGLKCGHKFNALKFDLTKEQIAETFPINGMKQFFLIAIEFTIGKETIDDKPKASDSPGE